MDRETPMRQTVTFKGKYRDIYYEIKKWKFTNDDQDRWAYYIYFNLNYFPKELKRKAKLKYKKLKISNKDMWITNPENNSVYSRLHSHCGFTYGENRKMDKNDFVIIGCDYSHYGDKGHYYSEHGIMNDVRQTIDDFREIVPNYRCFDAKDGELYLESEGEYKNGYFYKKG